MTEQQIIDKTMAIMNEIGDETSLTLLSEDTVKMSEYIESVIPDAIALVQRGSAKPVNPQSGSSASSTYVNGCLVVVKPDDYVKLLAFKLDSWARVTDITYGYSSDMYKRQKNTYTASGANKPVVVDGFRANGTKVLEAYPATSNDDIDVFVYEGTYESPESSTAEALDMDITDPVAIAICYMCASLVYSIFENKATSDEMSKISLSLVSEETEE